MGFFRSDSGPFLIERRTARRTRATCAASLRTLTDEIFGHLWDLSETGARISLPRPPEVGETAVLKWGTERVMCRVVWTEHDLCGLEFDGPIDLAVVSSSSRMLGIVEHQTAAMGNIAAGRKRSAPGASTTGVAQDRATLLATRSPRKGSTDLD
jgi:hypothetical protein